MIDAETLARIAGKPVNDNAQSVAIGLQARGVAAGLNHPHRLAHYLAQLGHESGGWHYDREVWGPTPAQLRYDTRTDLGNTPERDGDGQKYAGHGPMQVTGRGNTTEFRDWCRRMRFNPPDFAQRPELINTDPWEGISAVWYWETRGLNAYADQNNVEMITRRINGGLNGFADRLTWYTRAGLVLLGYAPTAVAAFQRAAGLKVDGIPGPATRSAIHTALKLREAIVPARAPTLPAATGPGFLTILFRALAALFKKG